MRRGGAGARTDPIRIHESAGTVSLGRVADLHGLEPVVVEAFAELNHGRLDGLRVSEMETRYGELARQWWTTPSVCRLPGGETLQEGKERALPALLRVVDRHPG
ncbi:MAG: histidine phosphatase family protein, partial [Armatimonadetes bacterium]|nr:histidine phosphatase family protein [Armatimonadota bacterium]